MKRLPLVLLAWWCLLFFPSALWAHRINVFAYVEGEKILGEVYFSDGTPVKGALVQIFDLEGKKTLGKTRTNSQGRFFFPLPKKAKGVKIVAKAEMGHQAEMTLFWEPKSSGKDSSKQLQSLPKKTSPQTLVSEETLRQMIREELQKEISPLKASVEEILKELRKPGLTQIIGGFGYIVGIFGLILWIKARR